MFRIVVVDVSAEARSRIAREIGRLQESSSQELSLLPKISIQQLSPEEIKFHGAPDLLIVGDELIASDIGSIGRIRGILPDTPIIARLRKDQESLLIIEDLARLGADDTINENIDILSLSKKVVLHCRRPKKGRTANLILVDSAKGGLGVTSVVAGLAEAMTVSGKKVAVVDLDSETQDLSRFLQARPFINENLEFLIDGVKPIAEEHVKQCLVPVWSEDDGLFCMSPSLVGDESSGLNPLQSRNFLSVIEIVDSLYDVVIIDVGSIRGAVLKTLYRVADTVLMLVNNDPASLYATVSRMSLVRQWINPTADFILVENFPHKSGLPSEILRREINLATNGDESRWYTKVLPECRAAARWPGSGDTIFSRGKRSLSQALSGLAERILKVGIASETAAPARDFGIFSTLRDKFSRTLPTTSSMSGVSTKLKELKLLPFKAKAPSEREFSFERTEAVFNKLAESKASSLSTERGPIEQESDANIEGLLKRAN